MDVVTLKKLIREATIQALSEISDSEELKSKISEYLLLSKEANELTESIKATLDLASAKQKSAEKMIKEVERYMNEYSISLLEADEWVAEIKDQLKYQRPTLGYKELWETALIKLNAATRNILQEMADAQLAEKSAEIIKKLQISPIKEDNTFTTVLGYLQGYLKRVLDLVKSFRSYKEVVKNLPKIQSAVVQEGIIEKKIHTVPKGVQPLPYNTSKRYVR